MFKTIVWASDGSEHAERALRLAAELAKGNGSKIVAIHVDELMLGRAGGYSVNVNEDDVKAGIEKAVHGLEEQGIDASLETASVGQGGAAHVIADHARNAGADLIVVGTRGHGPITGLLLGSVTQRLLQVAHCPVLAVPPEG